MKKLLFIALSVALFAAGCKKGESDDNGLDPLSRPVPADEIHYISSDGQVIYPYNEDFGTGVILISNTYENGMGVLKFSSPVVKIGHAAFYAPNEGNDGRRLTGIAIADSVTEVEQLAFSACINLRAFYGRFASADRRCLIIDRVLKAFAPHGLSEYTIPDGVVRLESSVFYACGSLRKLTLPDSVEELGTEVFRICKQLQAFYGRLASSDHRCLIIDGAVRAFAEGEILDYTIPEGVTSIGDSAFMECSSLLSVTLPQSLELIGAYAFCYCTQFEDITIPARVARIGYDAFGTCVNLKNVYCRPVTPPSMQANVFADVPEDQITLYVPSESVSAYKQAANWSKYSERIRGCNF